MKNIETATSVERKEFGKNVHVVLEFLRHATPGKNPDGTSADFITEGGKEMAKVKNILLREREIFQE